MVSHDSLPCCSTSVPGDSLISSWLLSKLLCLHMLVGGLYAIVEILFSSLYWGGHREIENQPGAQQHEYGGSAYGTWAIRNQYEEKVLGYQCWMVWAKPFCWGEQLWCQQDPQRSRGSQCTVRFSELRKPQGSRDTCQEPTASIPIYTPTPIKETSRKS